MAGRIGQDGWDGRSRMNVEEFRDDSVDSEEEEDDEHMTAMFAKQQAMVRIRTEDRTVQIRTPEFPGSRSLQTHTRPSFDPSIQLPSIATRNIKHASRGPVDITSRGSPDEDGTMSPEAGSLPRVCRNDQSHSSLPVTRMNSGGRRLNDIQQPWITNDDIQNERNRRPERIQKSRSGVTQTSSKEIFIDPDRIPAARSSECLAERRASHGKNDAFGEMDEETLMGMYNQVGIILLLLLSMPAVCIGRTRNPTNTLHLRTFILPFWPPSLWFACCSPCFLLFPPLFPVVVHCTPSVYCSILWHTLLFSFTPLLSPHPAVVLSPRCCPLIIVSPY